MAARNPVKMDPTRSQTLRRVAQADIRRRYRKVKAALFDLVVREDAFGLAGPKSILLAGNQRFRFQSTPEQLAGFRQWLEDQLNTQMRGIKIEDLDEAFLEKYIEEGYRKGAGRAFDDTRKAALQTGEDVSGFYQGTREEFLRSSFAQPVQQEKVKTLAARTMTDLKGATSDLATKLSRALTDGLVQGDNPRKIARDMAAIVNGNRRRAELIARTEIIRAHAEGQLDAMERLGVEEVGVQVEWSTAGDDRVCFPAFTMVTTLDGDIPIQAVRPGMMVLTRKGYKRVTAATKRDYSGKMVSIAAWKHHVTATSDHPFWDRVKQGWIPADALSVGDTLESFKDEGVKIDSVFDFRLSYSHNSPPIAGEVGIFSCVFGWVPVPVVTVDFEGYPWGLQEKVNRVSTKGSFLDIFNAEVIKRKSHITLYRCFRSGTSIARQAAKPLVCLGRASAKAFPTSVALNVVRRSSAFLGAMLPVKSTRNVGAFVPKASAACLARAPFAGHMLPLARDRAVVVSVLNTLVDGEVGATADTSLGDDDLLPAGVVAFPAAELASVSFTPVDKLSACWASTVSAIFSALKVARSRAKYICAAVFERLRVSGERLVAYAASKLKWHGRPLLSDITVLYHRLARKAIAVYDIQVEDEPEFFANGLLVHNCTLCKPLDGIVVTLKEARGKIPRHPNCRCAWTPANVGENQSGQKRSKSSIAKSISASLAAEIPQRSKRTIAQQKRRTSWAGVDTPIAAKRPRKFVSPARGRKK